MYGQNPVVKKNSKRGTVDITEIFYTIQGEGIFSGIPAVFIRFQHCCLRCQWCDTEFETGTTYTPKEAAKKAFELFPDTLDKSTRKLVVITGGEPFVQAGLVDLVEELIRNYFVKVQIETSGSVYQKDFESLLNNPLIGSYISIVCSPKTGKLNVLLEDRITAYKYVIKAGECSEKDGLPMVSPETGKSMRLARPKPFSFKPIFVMPCDEHIAELNQKNMQEACNSAMQFGYRLCLQIHKVIGLP